MKGKIPRITLLGSNSGNNLGDAAILSAILDSVSQELPDAEFYVPSTKPSFTNDNYGEQYNVKGVNVMPWTGSLRLLGIPTMYNLAKSDVALICDGIIFGKKFFDPTFNFLITLIFLVPWAKLVGCKLVCYNCGIGPFPVPMSRWAAKVLMNACDLVIMRENDSKKLAEELGVTKEISVTGDAAFINPISSVKRADEILKGLGADPSSHFFGINVTKYIDSWLKPGERVSDKSNFLNMLADGINSALDSVDDQVERIIFSTHPMDEDFCKQLSSKINGIVITNSQYLSHDMQAVMKKCGLFMGMRFHSLVLSSAVECPIIGLIYAPKVRGFMRLLECDHLGLELAELDKDKLKECVASAWTNRKELQDTQQAHIRELSKGARAAATRLREQFFPQ